MIADKINILHIEDSPADAEQVKRTLKKANLECDILVVDKKHEYEHALNTFTPHIILSDHSLPSFNSLAALQIAKQRNLTVPFILITATVSEEFAVSVLKEGADDYILKDRMERLPIAIINALEKHQALIEKQKTEELIRKSEANLTAIIENTDSLIYSLDKDLRYLTFNTALKNILKEVYRLDIKPGDKVITFLEQLEPSEAKEWRERYEFALTGQSLQFTKEFRVLEKTNFTNFSIHPIYEAGQVVGLSCFARDITQQKLAELEITNLNQRLLSSNNQLSVILNTLPANIALLDERGTIVAINESWKNFAIQNMMQHSNYGIGLNYIEVCNRAGGKDREVALQMANGLTQIIHSEIEEFALEYSCDSPDEKRWFRVEVRPLRSNGDVGMVVMHLNITKRKQAELEILDLYESLEKKVEERTSELQVANSELEAFNFTVSHDLRSPLQVISGYASLLIRKYERKFPEDAHEMLLGIKEYAKKMGMIIQDLLDFSKMGKTPLRKEIVDIDSLVQDIITEIKTSDENFHCRIIQHPINLICCDSTMIRHVWFNLISNAVKYSAKKEHPVVEIGCEEVNNETIYYVKDNGAGFDPKYIDKLFTVFQRLHTSEEFEGTGVGLALVQRIILKHGGRIWAESTLGEGAAFYFTLSEI